MVDITNQSQPSFWLKIDKAPEFSTQHSRQPLLINWKIMKPTYHLGTTRFQKVLPILKCSYSIILILLMIWMNIFHEPDCSQLYWTPGIMSFLSHPIPFDSSKQSPFPHLYDKGSSSLLSPLESHLCVCYLLLCNQHIKTECFKTAISLSLRWVDYWSVLNFTAKFSRNWIQPRPFGDQRWPSLSFCLVLHPTSQRGKKSRSLEREADAAGPLEAHPYSRSVFSYGSGGSNQRPNAKGHIYRKGENLGPLYPTQQNFISKLLM